MPNPRRLTAAESRERDSVPSFDEFVRRAHEAFERYVEFAASQGKAPQLDRETYVDQYLASLPASLVRHPR